MGLSLVLNTNPEKSPIPSPQLLPMLPPMPMAILMDIGDAKSVKLKPMPMLQPGTTDIMDTDTHITDTDTPVIMVSILLMTVSAITTWELEYHVNFKIVYTTFDF